MERQALAASATANLIHANDNNVIATAATTAAAASLALKKRQEWIPYIVFISGLITSLGSGMTVKFFPLFFKDEVGMTPSQVQTIYVLVPLGR